MAKSTIPRGLYLTKRLRADDTVVYRWGMAPGLRKQNIKAIDLVDDAGRPLGRAAAIARATELVAALKAGKPVEPPKPAGPGRTVDELVAAFIDPRNLDARLNKTTGLPLSKATKKSYRQWSVAILDVFTGEPVSNVDAALVSSWFSTVTQTRGHHMAEGALAVLRMAFNWAPRDWRCAEVEWDKVIAPKAPAKLRVGHEDELACLLMAMDNPEELYRRLADEGRAVNEDHIPARPELGDSLVIALWTTQRAADVLAFTELAFAGGRLRWTSTSKNKRRLDMPQLGPLAQRVADAKARKAQRLESQPELANVHQLVIDPEWPVAYNQDRHGVHFREARALAAKFFPSLLGEGLDPWGHEAKRFTFEDCRDTAITRLHDAGCDLMEICSWSNHKSPRSLMALIDSYIEISGRTADRAGRKVADWWAGRTGVV